jgi:hypothetical protein
MGSRYPQTCPHKSSGFGRPTANNDDLHIGCVCRKLDSVILVMKAAENRPGCDCAVALKFYAEEIVERTKAFQNTNSRIRNSTLPII